MRYLNGFKTTKVCRKRLGSLRIATSISRPSLLKEPSLQIKASIVCARSFTIAIKVGTCSASNRRKGTTWLTSVKRRTARPFGMKPMMRRCTLWRMRPALFRIFVSSNALTASPSRACSQISLRAKRKAYPRKKRRLPRASRRRCGGSARAAGQVQPARVIETVDRGATRSRGTRRRGRTIG